jgi:hypothetical protein
VAYTLHFSSPSCYLLPHMSKDSGLHIVFSTFGLCCSLHMRNKVTCTFLRFYHYAVRWYSEFSANKHSLKCVGANSL